MSNKKTIVLTGDPIIRTGAMIAETLPGSLVIETAKEVFTKAGAKVDVLTQIVMEQELNSGTVTTAIPADDYGLVAVPTSGMKAQLRLVDGQTIVFGDLLETGALGGVQKFTDGTVIATAQEAVTTSGAEALIDVLIK